MMILVLGEFSKFSKEYQFFRRVLKETHSMYSWSQEEGETKFSKSRRGNVNPRDVIWLTPLLKYLLFRARIIFGAS